MVYKIQCAWCGKPLGFKEDDREWYAGHDTVTSHGICPACRWAILEKESISKNDQGVDETREELLGPECKLPIN